MIDWTKSMQQTYEYYIVDPDTWGDIGLVTDILGCKITRDLGNETLGSASIDCDSDLTDKYIRCYLVVTQNKERQKVPLGTYICQTPSITYDGKRQTMSQDGYTPLIELKEKVMDIGYAVNGSESNPVASLKLAALITEENVRAPVVSPLENGKMMTDASFLSEMEDTKLTFVSDLLNLSDYRFGLDEMGRILFEPNQKLEAMKPKFEFNDDNSSILLPSLSMQRDLYGVPNVVEVIYSTANEGFLRSVAKNEDANSDVSIPSRGREIWYRETNPGVVSGINQTQLDEYTNKLLKDLSSIEYTITYTHGYCDVRLGDCVRLNYASSGLNGVNAKVIKQVIDCKSGCMVEETAVFNKNLME